MRLYSTKRVQCEPLHACIEFSQLQFCLRSKVQEASDTDLILTLLLAHESNKKKSSGETLQCCIINRMQALNLFFSP